ncbi:unnamed protein product [Acidithrix sp. C25]|nr:unnamed protein product [Acidithrix sp. C25]
MVAGLFFFGLSTDGDVQTNTAPNFSFSDDDPKIAQFQIPTRSSSPK